MHSFQISVKVERTSSQHISLGCMMTSKGSANIVRKASKKRNAALLSRGVPVKSPPAAGRAKRGLLRLAHYRSAHAPPGSPRQVHPLPLTARRRTSAAPRNPIASDATAACPIAATRGHEIAAVPGHEGQSDAQRDQRERDAAQPVDRLQRLTAGPCCAADRSPIRTGADRTVSTSPEARRGRRRPRKLRRRRAR